MRSRFEAFAIAEAAMRRRKAALFIFRAMLPIILSHYRSCSRDAADDIAGRYLADIVSWRQCTVAMARGFATSHALHY